MVNFNDRNLSSKLEGENNFPDWALLEFRQCKNCPLTNEDTLYCPLAVNLVAIIYWCKDLISYDEVNLIVKSAEREVRLKTSLQRVISSLLGL